MIGLVLEDVLNVYAQPTTDSGVVGEVHSAEELELGTGLIKENLVWFSTSIDDGLLHGWVAVGTPENRDMWIAWRKK